MRFIVAGVLLGLLIAPTSEAHEVGKTQVTALFRADASYEFDFVVDPDALLAKLEIYAGAVVSGELASTERDRRIEALQEVFLDFVRLRFDGVRARPRFQYVPAPTYADSPNAPSMVRLTGSIPRGARRVTLNHGLALGSFAMNVRMADGRAEIVWIEGSKESPALSLAALPPAGTIDSATWQYLGLAATAMTSIYWRVRRSRPSARGRFRRCPAP